MTPITSSASLVGVNPTASNLQPAPAAVTPALARAQPAPVPTSNIPKVDAEKMRQQLREAIERLNAELQKSSQELRFSMDDVLDYPVVTVKNIVTGDVVRQIPNETTIRMAHSMERMRGLLFNNEA